MKKLFVLLLLVLPFSVVARSGNASAALTASPDSFAAWIPSAGVIAQLSQTGYSTAITGTLQWKRWALSAGGKMVISKAYLFADGPYGIVTGIYFFPNGCKQRFSGFINADYQLTFQGNNRSPAQDIPNHKVHEYTAGYGFTYSLNGQLNILSSISFGRYTETMISAYTDEKVSFSGYNSLLRLGINYTLRR